MNFDKVTITQQLRYKQIMNTQAKIKVVCHCEINAQETPKKGTKNKINKQNTIQRHAL